MLSQLRLEIATSKPISTARATITNTSCSMMKVVTANILINSDSIRDIRDTLFLYLLSKRAVRRAGSHCADPRSSVQYNGVGSVPGRNRSTSQTVMYAADDPGPLFRSFFQKSNFEDSQY